MTTVGVVGAGLSGLVAARRLRAAGRRVVLFDKGRRPGGRANTREHRDRRFDHGAQFFTVRDPRVQPLLTPWLESGLVAEWTGRLVRFDGTTVTAAKPAERYVAVPGMIDLALHLAAELDVRTGVRIGSLARDATGWTATDEHGGRHGPFDQMVVAVPAPQAVPLLEAVPALRTMASRVEMEPCWAVMLSFDTALPLDFDGAFIADGALSWMARNGSKPGRPDPDAWVLHATPEWTRAHWEVDRDAIPALLLQEVEKRWGPVPAPSFERAHRWGYALASRPGDGAAVDPASGLGVCGDWCVGGRVEGAIVSGLDVADGLLRLEGP